MSLLEQDTARKGRVYEYENEEYKVDGIQDSTMIMKVLLHASQSMADGKKDSTIHAKESEHETAWNPTAIYQGSASPMQLQLYPST